MADVNLTLNGKEFFVSFLQKRKRFLFLKKKKQKNFIHKNINLL